MALGQGPALHPRNPERERERGTDRGRGRKKEKGESGSLRKER